MRSAAFTVALLTGALLGTVVASQTPAPLSDPTPEQQQTFRQCRAAIFYHLDPAAEARVVPKAMAEALRQQIVFIMHETLRTAPGRSVGDAQRTIDFAENFFISFSVTVSQQRTLREDVEAREALLISCVPVIWMVATQHVDRLMAGREAALSR